MADTAGTFAAVSVALYAAHHVGDYWVQTDHQARHKSDAGSAGALQCLLHVLSYLMTQVLFLAGAVAALGIELSVLGILAGLAVSGVTHYAADRREHGLMFKLARALPGKAAFLRLGVPRAGVEIPIYPSEDDEPPWFAGDNPSLGTGAWALDQSWHIFWGVFVAGMLIAVI